MKARRERLETRIIRLSTDIFLFPASSSGCALWPDLWGTVQTLNFHEGAKNPETAKGSARGGSGRAGPSAKEERGGSARNEWETGEPWEGELREDERERVEKGEGTQGRGPRTEGPVEAEDARFIRQAASGRGTAGGRGAGCAPRRPCGEGS